MSASFSVQTDLPAGSLVKGPATVQGVSALTQKIPRNVTKVCGSATELGAWDVYKAPCLAEVLGTPGLYAGSIAVAAPPGTALDFKYVAHKAGTPGDWWVWQPGPNRSVVLGRPGAAAPPAPVQWCPARDGTAVIDQDTYLEPHRAHLQHRYKLFTEALALIESMPGGLDAFTRGWESFGLNRHTTAGGQTGVLYKEWAPGASAISLVGDFNGWDDTKHVCVRDEAGLGMWSVFIPDGPDGAPAIPHGSCVKASVAIAGGGGARVTRLPAWIRYATYDPALNEYCGRYWDPPAAERHVWKYPRPSLDAAGSVVANYALAPGVHALPPVDASTTSAAPSLPPPAATVPKASAPATAGLRIYEAHVGMAGEAERVSTYREFADTVIPRIAAGGYNCVQLMAIMEHAYYGSFGYHVTSFMAPSSRFGTPEDLKYLVDAAHGAGLAVIMDLVHSHAAKNVNDGLNAWDGTDHHYFHAGGKGNHDLWDSRLFDYGKVEVQRFLLSSARYFIEEFRFDGYRFDGVTSMMYAHHGLGVGFSGGYHEYFGGDTDLQAVVYLMLANHVLHTITPPALTIAEDVSGMPTLCRPVIEGGVGFDYRLGMAIPDVWIKVLKECTDEEWDVGKLVFTLTNRRWQEKTITYAESHDQALVGDKTIAFWLMDKEMYWHMSTLESPVHPVIDRGLALHKSIRLLTYGLGGEGYLNFMGNEWGHPEWIDFPREGNGWSYKHCRRQWSLVDDGLLHYKHLAAWDRGMHALETAFPWLLAPGNYVSLKHEGDKVVVFERHTPAGPLVFVFNFHPSASFPGYRIGVPEAGDWTVALDSDWPEFGGHGRVDRATVFPARAEPWCERPASLEVYTPSRTVLVLKRANAAAAPIVIKVP